MITAIDHVVLTVRDVNRSISFYERVLGVKSVTFAGNRQALIIGDQKINLQTIGQETRNHACIGSGDLCLLTHLSPDDVIAHLHGEDVQILEGPVGKTGARGPITSVYFNDPDGNLIEVASYVEPHA